MILLLRVFLILSCLLFSDLVPAFAQQEGQEKEAQKIMAYGINFNSRDGIFGGLSFRYLKLRKSKRYHLYSFDLVDIKHPKELRTSNPLTGEFYIPGKANFLYALRALYGRENVFFRKSQEQGVQIHGSLAAGPVLALVAPYIVDYLHPNNLISRAPYHPEQHPNFDNIIGTAPLGEALAEGRFAYGASVRASLTFEYSSIKNNVIGVEAGALIDVLNEKVVIMPLSHNNQVFPTLYLSFNTNNIVFY